MMKGKYIPIVAVLAVLISSSIGVAADGPEPVKTTGEMNVTVTIDEKAGFWDRVGSFLGRTFAVSIREDQYEPGDTAEGEVWGTIDAVCSENECTYGSEPECDGDDVSVCVSIQHEDKSVPSGYACVDSSECTTFWQNVDWSAEIYQDADEGTYDVFAAYKNKDWYSGRTEHYFGDAGTIEVKTCEPEAYKECYNGDVYWYDSCDQRGDLYDSCDSDEECSNGECVSVCEERAYKECYNGDVYWYDSCDDRGDVYEDCGDDEYGKWNSFCEQNTIMRDRDVTEKYCEASSCQVDTTNVEEIVEECGSNENCIEGATQPVCELGDVQKYVIENNECVQKTFNEGEAPSDSYDTLSECQNNLEEDGDGGDDGEEPPLEPWYIRIWNSFLESLGLR